MLININIQLLLRRKNHPEMKASFLFNILGTIADNLRVVIEFTPKKKQKSVLHVSFHLKLNIANILWEQVVTIHQL